MTGGKGGVTGGSSSSLITINAGAVNDLVVGGYGSPDVINAGSGQDYVYGKAGDDVIDGGSYTDAFVGGSQVARSCETVIGIP